MTISYTLQPIPFWYFSDLTGKPLAGGKMTSTSSLNPTQFKPIFQDPAGINQWPTDGAPFDETGTGGPFYFRLDSDNPDDLYFLQIFDNNGNLVRQINQYPISGGSGGGSVNTVQNIENIFVNNSFIYNIGSTTDQPIADQTFICPSAHVGLYYPDIKFIQSGASNAQDTLSFSQFTFGTNPLSPDFATPYYLNYTCLNSPSGEVYKGIRIPISQYVNSVANQIFTFYVYGRTNGSGSDTINVQLRQYFGTGGTPSIDRVTNLTPTPITLTSSFVIYTINFSIPSIVGKNPSNSNDDGTYIEILFPLSAQCNIDLAKPSLYSGSIFPTTSYESVDEIEAKLENPRTGNIRESFNSFSNSPIQSGWIPLNDGTIGNSSSNSTTRANPDTWLLYKLLWEGTSATDCPIYDSSGVLVSKGGTPLSDWNANNQLQLPLSVGKTNVNKGASGYSPYSQSYTAVATTDILTVASTTGLRTGYPIELSGGTPPIPLSNGITYFAIVLSSTTMKLSFSSDGAISGNAIDLTVDGNGTITNPPVYLLGHAQGEFVHQDTISEMPSHNHPGSNLPTNIGNAASGGGGTTRTYLTLNTGNSVPVSVESQGGNIPHNNVQPSSFCNRIIKL
jgi:hypothetical protein